MPDSQHDDQDAPPAGSLTPLLRQWRRAALALAFLFASLPLAGRLFLGSWRFDGAWDCAGLCLAAAAYLYFAGRDSRPPIPDSAIMLDEALRLAAMGQSARARALLDQALRLNPDLWQAWQYRGELRLDEPAGAESAVEDFTHAIRLAPGEAHLYILRSQALAALGRDALARDDLDTAARLQGAGN